MARKLKALGMAFVAVFATSAIAASAAHAEEQFFHSHKNPTVITGENTGTGHEGAHVFEIFPGLAIACGIARFDGTEEATSTHETSGKATTYTTKALTVTPTYNNCTLGGRGVAIDTTTNECHYTLSAETTETTAGKPMGNVEVICRKAGGTINLKIAQLGIEIRIGNQVVPHAISYETVNTTSQTEKQEVTITATAGLEGAPGVHWTCTPKAACVTGLGASEGNASYAGKVTVKGYEDLEKTETGTYKEGPQTGIFYGPTQ